MQNATSKLKNKHNHKLTDCLKAVIFSLVMLAPIFSIAIRCGYVMFNKNAYESYYGETINQETNLNININNLQNGYNYFFQNNLITPNNETGIINDFTVSNVIVDGNISAATSLRFFVNNSNHLILQFGGANRDLTTTQYVISFKYVTRTNDNFSEYINTMLYKKEYNNYSYLDNAFTYGISNLKNESVFNWTQNTAIYTPIHAMTTGLGITEDAIAIMLTYWALMTAIYIVFDIVIVIFTKITHFLQN